MAQPIPREGKQLHRYRKPRRVGNQPACSRGSASTAPTADAGQPVAGDVKWVYVWTTKTSTSRSLTGEALGASGRALAVERVCTALREPAFCSVRLCGRCAADFCLGVGGGAGRHRCETGRMKVRKTGRRYEAPHEHRFNPTRPAPQIRLCAWPPTPSSPCRQAAMRIRRVPVGMGKLG